MKVPVCKSELANRASGLVSGRFWQEAGSRERRAEEKRGRGGEKVIREVS
jgi:hypothetical protein